MGHSGGSTSTPSEAPVMSNHSGDSRAEHDSAAEEKKSPPRKVLGKRRGEQLASGDRSEKKGLQMYC